MPVRAPRSATVAVAPDDVSLLHRVRATVAVAGPDPVTVTFAIRRPGAKTWQRLGTDVSAPYRVYVDLRRYRVGTPVYLVAVVRSSSGEALTSPVVEYRVER